MRRIFTLNNLHSDKNGFSIVETLIAIAILALAIVGPLAVASASLNAAFVAKDRLIAISLAQDAIEYIKNMRDQNRLQGLPWLTTISLCKQVDSNDFGCIIDSNTNAPPKDIMNSTVSSNNGPVMYHPLSGLYGHDNTWQESKFIRRVVLVEAASNREAVITVTVRWSTGVAVEKIVSVRGSITNW